MAIERRALLVLGMHRSGTSALTRVLNIYGATLPATLLPANSGNVTGYWESTAIVRFNDALLDALGSRWDGPLWFSLESLDAGRAREYAGEAAALIASEFGDAPLLVIKDPRLCRLLPIWRQALALLEIEPLPILLIRHPFEAAASMRTRDNMPDSAGLLLWLQYVLAAEQGSRTLRRALLFYDDLLADCPGAMDRIQSRLGIALPAAGSAAAAEAAGFLSPSLRHERASDFSFPDDADVSRWVRTVYAWFERGRNGQVPSDPAELDAVRVELAEAETLFGGALAWHRRIEQQRFVHMTATARHWEEQAASLESRFTALSVAEAACREQIRQLECRLTAAGAADESWRKQIQQLESRLTAADATEAALREQVQHLELQVTAARETEMALREQVRQLEATMLRRLRAFGRQVYDRYTGDRR